MSACWENVHFLYPKSDVSAFPFPQAMCSLGGLTQGVSAPLEAAAEEIQMTQARLMDAQAQLQAQAAEHTEHLKWRFAEEEEMRMESEELRRRTQVSSRKQEARSDLPGEQQGVL